MFTVRGRFYTGHPAAITWDEGVISGEGADMATILALSYATVNRQIGPHEGPYCHRDYLKEPLCACFFLLDLLLPGATVEGDVPDRPPIPAGAIGD